MPVRDLLSAASTQGAAPADPYFYDVSLLLNGDGTNGAQNNTFLDSSTNNFTITRNGNTTQGSFSPYGSNWGNYFSSSSYISAAYSTAFQFGSGNWTVECWVNPASIGAYQAIFNNTNTSSPYTGYGLSINASGFVDFSAQVSGSPTGQITATNRAIQANVWTHIAVTYNGTTPVIYVNGVACTATIGSTFTNVTTNTAVYIGCTNIPGYIFPYTGYISNLRLNNTVVYSSNFTPSIIPLTAISGTKLLTCQSNRFIDNSSANAAISVNGTPQVQRFSPFNPTAPYSTTTIGGSGYFDGSTGTYLNTPSSSTFDFSTGGNFTVEYWYYPLDTGTSRELTHGTGDCGNISYQSDGSVYGYFGGGAQFDGRSAPQKQIPFQWNHVAFVLSGTNGYTYLNGVQIASGSGFSVTSTGAQTWQIGSSRFPVPYGYMSDVRYVKGTALYTGSTYTVPTAPETAITNTALLTNFTNAGIPDLAMQNDLQTVGSAQVSTSVKKYGTGSLSFPGSSDLVLPNNYPAYFGGGNFTVEGWLYFSSAVTGVYQVIANLGYETGPTQCWLIYLSTDATLHFSYNNGTYYDASLGASGMTTNTWYHVAVVRNGSTVTGYVNGVALSSPMTIGTNIINSNSSAKFSIGVSTMDYFTGYMDDVRITKGLARYTTTFTPPTAALPTY